MVVLRSYIPGTIPTLLKNIIQNILNEYNWNLIAILTHSDFIYIYIYIVREYSNIRCKPPVVEDLASHYMHYFFCLQDSLFGNQKSQCYRFFFFYPIFSCKISLFCGVGWSFWVNNDTFFHAKHQLLRGWVVFLSKKNTFFWDFLENVGSLNFD